MSVKIKIAVATNKHFYLKSLPVVLTSLLESGIPKEDIHIFNNAFESSYDEQIDNITHHYMDHNSCEHGALVEIVEKQLESDYWFLIHDTCKVGPNFKTLLYNIPESKPEKIALTVYPSMCIGSYRYDYLLSQKEKILSLKNQWRYAVYTNEDSILWYTDPPAVCYNGYNSWCCELLNENDNWFGTETIRRSEYYPSLDLYKNKSNWGQHLAMNHMPMDTKFTKFDDIRKYVYSLWEKDSENKDETKYRSI